MFTQRFKVEGKPHVLWNDSFYCYQTMCLQLWFIPVYVSLHRNLGGVGKVFKANEQQRPQFIFFCCFKVARWGHWLSRGLHISLSVALCRSDLIQPKEVLGNWSLGEGVCRMVTDEVLATDHISVVWYFFVSPVWSLSVWCLNHNVT